MKLSLVVSQGNPVGKEIPVRQPQFVIGRDPECQLRPASPLVSKRHCAILIRGERVYVRDFGSTNGTIVNSEPLKGEIEVVDGDELKFGPLAFRFKLVPDAVPAPANGDTISEKAEASLSDTGTMRVGNEKKKAPEPALADTRPLPAKGRSSEDDIADMLFGIEGDSSANIAIPGGTTVMQALQPEDEPALEAAAATAGAGTDDKSKPKVKIQDNKATSDAAKAILDKYMRRPRV